jgi:chemotaxis protein histidine kinase CheA
MSPIRKSNSAGKVEKKSRKKSFFESKAKDIVSESKPVTIVQDKVEIDETPKKEIKVIEIPPRVKQAPMVISNQSAEQAEMISKMFEDDEMLESVRKEKVMDAPQNILDNQKDKEPQMETRRIRKKRKVKKTLTFMQGKYMTTKDVEEWESYSEDESVPIGKQQPKLIPIDSSVKGQGKIKQKTLLNFFKKT